MRGALCDVGCESGASLFKTRAPPAMSIRAGSELETGGGAGRVP